MSHEFDPLDLDAETHCPQGLRDDLRALYGTGSTVPDEAVCSAARTKFVRLRRRRLILRLAPAAAAALTGAVVWGLRDETRPAVSLAIATVPSQGVADPQDIDGSGQVDVFVDAGDEALGAYQFELNGEGG